MIAILGWFLLIGVMIIIWIISAIFQAVTAPSAEQMKEAEAYFLPNEGYSFNYSSHKWYYHPMKLNGSPDHRYHPYVVGWEHYNRVKHIQFANRSNNPEKLRIKNEQKDLLLQVESEQELEDYLQHKTD